MSISSSNDRTLTKWLLNDGLDEYAKVVDDEYGLNNYAEYINSLCSKSLKPAIGIGLSVSHDRLNCVVFEIPD